MNNATFIEHSLVRLIRKSMPASILLAAFAIGSAGAAYAQLSSNATVFATSLNNPRGLKFGPDGYLYVAEGGAGGTLSTVGQTDQVPFPIGPYTGGFTARISKISRHGVVTTVVDGLPSSQTNPASGSLVSGVSDVAFLGDTLYALLAGAGPSHGLIGTTNGILRVNGDGTTTLIADLSAFQKANPVANPDTADFEPDGTWYSMVAVHGSLYAVEPNHEEIDEITRDGEITRVIDVSATHPSGNSFWLGPTSIAYHGNFYVGFLGQFPMVQGGEAVRKITPSGQIKGAATGLTAVQGVAFDDRHRMYVLESFTGQPFPGPPAAGTGMILRVEGDGSLETIATGLSFPTAMTFGPDGALYVSNVGFGAPPIGLGQIVRVIVPR